MALWRKLQSFFSRLALFVFFVVVVGHYFVPRRWRAAFEGLTFYGSLLCGLCIVIGLAVTLYGGFKNKRNKP
jgi:hypothetical protein